MMETKKEPGVVSSIWIEKQFRTRKSKAEYSEKELERIKEYLERKERLGSKGKRYVMVRKIAKRMGVI